MESWKFYQELLTPCCIISSIRLYIVYEGHLGQYLLQITSKSHNTGVKPKVDCSGHNAFRPIWLDHGIYTATLYPFGMVIITISVTFSLVDGVTSCYLVMWTIPNRLYVRFLWIHEPLINIKQGGLRRFAQSSQCDYDSSTFLLHAIYFGMC